MRKSHAPLFVLCSGIIACCAVAALGSAWGQQERAAAAQAAPAATPRTADGHPDLTGIWRRAAQGGPGSANATFQVIANASETEGGGEETALATRDGNIDYVEIDAEFSGKASQDMPLYKPESWDRVHRLEEFSYRKPADPAYGCRNPGIARLQAPTEIVQLPKKLILLYAGEHIWVREIPVDGRALPKEDDYEGVRVTGTSIGYWQGDDLVVETVDFTPDMVWYGGRGWIASQNAKIVERFRRDGDNIKYDMTITDPLFVKPWVRPSITLTVNKDAKALVLPPSPCLDRDGDNLPPSGG